MTNVIKISVAKENTCKEIEVQNHYLKFSTIEELEEKLSRLPYSQKIKSILRLKDLMSKILQKHLLLTMKRNLKL